jgi:hypothetical protein
MFKPRVKIILRFKLKVEMFLIFWFMFKILLDLKINLFRPKG